MFTLYRVFHATAKKGPRRNQKRGIEYLPVPVLGLDVVGEGLGLDVGRVVVTVVVVVYWRLCQISGNLRVWHQWGHKRNE